MSTTQRTILLIENKEGSKEIRFLRSMVSQEEFTAMFEEADKEDPAFIVPKRTRAKPMFKPLMWWIKEEIKLTLDDLIHMFGPEG